VIVPIALALQMAAPRDAWFGADKLKHFFVAAFTQSVTYSVLQVAKVKHDHAMMGAWAVTATVSVAKEVHDRRTTGLFSIRDLVWDAAGAGAASLLIHRSVRRAGNDDSVQMPPAASVLSRLASRPILPRVVISASAPVR
jgi:uncharacterized protein YfiM (DUF2279 family)